jgi:hypothetical protein
MFAWGPTDMPGIPRELAEHELKIFPNAKTHQTIDAPLQSGQRLVDGRIDKSSPRGKVHQGDKGGHMAITTGHGGK